MIRFTRAQAQPIGVDIGSDSVKLLQMELAGDSLSVLAAARESLPPAARAENLKDRTAAAADLIREILRRNPFSGRRIVAALPREIVHVKNLRLPLMPTDELRSAIEFEVKNIFPFEPKDARVRFLNAGEVRQGADARQEVIVIAALRADIDTFLCELHRSGTVVESLDFEPAAIYRSVERFIRRREDEQEVNVLVDVGGTRTQVIIGRSANISFFKPIEIGGQSLNDAVSHRLGITPDEARDLRRRLIEASPATPEESRLAPEESRLAPEESRRESVRQAVVDATRSIIESLATEVSLCLRYHSVTFRGHRPARLRLVGGEAADPQLLATFNAMLPIPTEAGRPLHSVDISRMRPADRQGLLSEWSTAFGLGLRLTTGRFGPRDGKPRNPAAPRPALGGSAQVIDLAAAVGGTGGAKRTRPLPAAAQATEAQTQTLEALEAIHA